MVLVWVFCQIFTDYTGFQQLFRYIVVIRLID